MGQTSFSTVSTGFRVYAPRMTSFRTKAATQLVSVLGLKRRLQELADSYDDSAQFDRLLRKIRKYDRRDPPWKGGYSRAMSRSMWTDTNFTCSAMATVEAAG